MPQPSDIPADLHQLRILHAIAHKLNGEVELQAILNSTLRQTVELLGLHTGWVWLVSPGSRSVFLAASHHLPPALAQHPERLSGWCHCIDKYLADHLDEAVNISEITCSRLKDLKDGTEGLRYHASVPLVAGRRKIGIMNVVSQQSQELDTMQLQLLYTIGDLLSMAVERTHLYENSRHSGASDERHRLAAGLRERLLPGLEALALKTRAMQAWLESGNQAKLDEALRQTQRLLDEMSATTERTLSDLNEPLPVETERTPIQYPTIPLTTREREVLQEMRSGKSNKDIAAALFVTERTVKFHVSSILQKLEAGNRTEAVQIALQRGIVQL